MRVFVTGSTGWLGRYVVQALKKRNQIILTDLNQADAIIHLAWAGLPNYTNVAHLRNIGWQVKFLKEAEEQGITNITIAGTCLETLDKLVPYSIAKLAIRARAFELNPITKWVRLWYLYGKGQNENCLLPRLLKAKQSGTKRFSVIDGERDFIDVRVAAERICDAALQNKVSGIIDCCTGKAETVLSFCQRHVKGLTYRTDYPTPFYEPHSFHGDPRKMDSIESAK